MAIPQPITQKDYRNQLLREREARLQKEKAVVSKDRRRFSVANDALKGVSSSDGLHLDRPGVGGISRNVSSSNAEQFEESSEERREQESLEQWNQQEASRLAEVRRREQLIQEYAEREELEEDASGTGNFTTKTEPVKLSSYSALFMVACFKDLMDYTVVFALPGISTVVSFCANTLILLLLFFPKRRYKITSNARLAIIDAFILIGLVPLEGLMFPFNLLPFTIAGVGMIYMTDKKFVAKRNAKKFDKKDMKGKMSAILRQAYVDRAKSRTEKGEVSEQMKEAFSS